MSGSGGKKETPSYAEEMFEHKVKWLAGVDSPASEALSTEVYQELLKEDEKKADEPEPNFELLSNPARVMKAQLKVVALEEGRNYITIVIRVRA